MSKSDVKKIPIRKKLRYLIHEKSGDNFAEYKEESSWKNFNKQEKLFLAILFMKRGKKLFSCPEQQEEALEFFAIARNLSSHHYLLYQQAIILSKDRKNEKNLELASDLLNKAVSCSKKFYKAWEKWGQILLQLGMIKNDVAYLYDADKKFKKSFSLSNPKKSKFSLYYSWGLCWYFIGKKSEEPVDYLHALKLFKEIEEEGLNESYYLNDKANVLFELGILIGNPNLCKLAIDSYNKCVQIAPNHFKGWLNLGISCEFMYRFTREKEFYYLGCQSFKKAAHIKKDYFDIWFLWGSILICFGKKEKDKELIQEGVEKLEMANRLKKDSIEHLLVWAEGLLWLGSKTEALDTLVEAEKKIAKYLRHKPNNIFGLYLYATYFKELGKYHQDEHNLLFAIEKFRYILSIEPNNTQILHGLADCLHLLGDYTKELTFIEEAAYSYHRIEEIMKKMPFQYWLEMSSCYLKLAEMTEDKFYAELTLKWLDKAIDKDLKHTINHDHQLEYLLLLGKANLLLGEFTQELNFYQNAIQYFSTCLNISPNASSYVHLYLGQSMLFYAELTSDIEFLKKSINQFQIFSHLEEDNEDNLNSWGIALIQLALASTKDPKVDSWALFSQAEEKFIYSIRLGNTEAFYHIACLYSLVSNFNLAMYYFEKAERANNIPPLESILEDEWLGGLRNTKKFKQFLLKIKKNS